MGGHVQEDAEGVFLLWAEVVEVTQGGGEDCGSTWLKVLFICRGKSDF